MTHSIAREIGIEPYELRLLNMVHPAQMKDGAATGKQFDSGDHPECLRLAVEKIDLAAVRHRDAMDQ